MKRLIALLLTIPVLMGISQMALGHGITKPQHGGIVQGSGEALLELVQEAGGVALYVLNEDEPVDAKAMSAKLNVSSGGKKTEVEMQPTEGNRFFAKNLKLAKGATVAVLVIDHASHARIGTNFSIQ